MPQRGNIAYDQIRQAARKGAGTQVQMFGGGATPQGYVAVYNASGDLIAGSGTPGGGTVSSVGLALPADLLSVTGSPVTTAGTLTGAKVAQAANLFYASPSGVAGVPTFRGIIAADIPAAVMGALQTPWLQNIDAAGYTLSNVPTVTGNGNITLAAGGAGALNLQTNAKTRLSVDSAGQVTINKPDSGFHLTLTGGGANIVVPGGPLYLNGQTSVLLTSGTSYLQRLTIDSAGHVVIALPDDSGSQLQLTGSKATIAASGDFYLTSPTTDILWTNGKNRLTIDSAGHCTINAPDSGATSGLYAAGCGIEASAFLANLYWNGSAWISRNNAAGFLAQTTGSNFGFWFIAPTTVGAAVSPQQHWIFYPGSVNYSAAPFAQALAGTGAALESSLNNNSLLIESNGTTQLVFRYKGNDGVWRQYVMTVA